MFPTNMNDLSEIKLENNRLKNELQFAHSFIDLLEDYRQLMTTCIQKCDNCQKNEDISEKFQYLETTYTKHQEFARNNDPKQYQFNSMANNGRELVVGHSGGTGSLPKNNSSQTNKCCHSKANYGYSVIGNTFQEIKSETTLENVFSDDDNDSDFDPDSASEDDSEEDIKPDVNSNAKSNMESNVTSEQKTSGQKASDGPIPCSWPGCEQTFNSRKKLYKHVSVHSPDKKYKCDQCEYSHRKLPNLESHKNRVHRGIRPFKCDKCDKAFTAKKTLEKHIRNIHKEVSEESLHSCDWVGCEFKTRYMMNLKEHMRRHTRERKFKCSWSGCDKSYYTSKKLSVHTNSAHEVCDWPGCTKAFKRRDNLLRHKKLHDPNQHKICEWPECGMTFTRQDKLKNHMKTHIRDNPKLTEFKFSEDTDKDIEIDNNVNDTTITDAISEEAIQTLIDQNWLNDEIINFYFNLIVVRGRKDNFGSIYAFNTTFYEKLSEKGLESVKRWTRRVDIFTYDLIFIPIHLGAHWCLVVINNIEKNLYYYDSMGGGNDKCITTLKGWLQAEYLAKKNVELPLTEWTFGVAKGIPQQTNTDDCGVFICKYGDYISRNAELNFSQSNIPNIRQSMIIELRTKQLISDN